MALPPGTLLQQIHFRRRLRVSGIKDGFFCDVGAGRGHLSNLLLKHGLSGEGFDLSNEACAENRLLNRHSIAANRYCVRREDFMTTNPARRPDIIACSMVLEHWPEDQVENFFIRARDLLRPGGLLFIFVPGSPRHWGIEDDISGHLRRYTFDYFAALAPRAGLVIRDLRGLTYPLSNLLLPVSNWLIRRRESYKLSESVLERTISSGVRAVPFKTLFPAWTACVLNEVILYPFHVLQHLARRQPASLVIYCEMGVS